MKQKWIEPQGERDKSTIIFKHFNSPVLTINKTSRQKSVKDTEDLNNNVNYLDLIDIYRTLHSTKHEYTLFSSVHGIFTTTFHILVHKTSFDKF